MTESQMIGFAAKAHGFIDDATTSDDNMMHGLHKGTDGVFYVVTPDGWTEFKPRTDNGHAFQLSMIAGIMVRQMGPYVYAIGKTQHQVRFDDSGDMMKAAREAVFMAAVEIGKAMK